MFELFKKNEYKNIIFIDLENVHSQGFDGIDTLTKEDKIFLYYSKNAKNISIDVFEKYKQGNISIETIGCTSGKNALDCVLSTHLGALINQYRNAINYYIVSKDKDYQSVIDFWKAINIKQVKALIQIHNPDAVVDEPVKKQVNKKQQVKKQPTKKQVKQVKTQPTKKKHKINVRSMIGTCIKDLKKPELDAIDSIIKYGNKDTYANMLNKKFGVTKGKEYEIKLKRLFDKINK